MNALSTNSRSLPTVPRPPVRLHIYYHLQAVNTLMALFSAPRRRMFRPLLGLDLAFSPFTCDYAARFHLYSSQFLIPT